MVVMGTVTSDSGEPIDGASVDVALPGDETVLSSTSTDETGTYEATFTVFEENAPSQLRLKFAAPEFMNKDVVVGFGTEVQRDVVLEAIMPKSFGSETKATVQQLPINSL